TGGRERQRPGTPDIARSHTNDLLTIHVFSIHRVKLSNETTRYELSLGGPAAMCNTGRERSSYTTEATVKPMCASGVPGVPDWPSRQTGLAGSSFEARAAKTSASAMARSGSPKRARNDS